MVFGSFEQFNLSSVDEKRRMVEVFPDPVRKQWNKWEVRGLVLLSLTLQISLIYSGNRRKYIAKRRIRIFIWCAYLLADWVATVALGLLVDRQGNWNSSNRSEYGDLTLMAFWSPFLLLHLGGPDTITAYALADNELWLRHLLGLVVQTAAAIYITLLAWEGTLISFLTVPMLVCGIIKYGERTWVLMSANREQFRDSVLAERDPGPSYSEDDVENAAGVVAAPSIPEPDASMLHIAYYFFETLKFKRLFVDLILGFHPRDVSQSFFEQKEYNTAFEVIEAELGFAYDVFYTKAPVIYTHFGLFFRLMTSFISLSVLLTFVASINMGSHKHQVVDVVITCILLIGAILLEVYAAISLLFSDWASLWFSNRYSKFPFGQLVSSLQSVRRLIRLWLSEGFVEPAEEIILEDVVEGYLEELVKRNMVEFSRRRSDGSPKKCRMNGALHDIFLPMALKIGLFHLHQKSDENLNVAAEPPFGVRRVVECTNIKTWPVSKAVNQNLQSYISFNGRKKDMPENLGNLFHLRYLGLRWTFLDTLPSSLGALLYLETLDIKHTHITTLPSSVWNMKHLRHLCLNGARLDIPLRKLDLTRQSFSTVVTTTITTAATTTTTTISQTSSYEEISLWISKLTSLRSLRLRSKDKMGRPSDLIIEPFSSLEHLSQLYLLGHLHKPLDWYQIPPGLKVLTLSVSRLDKDPMPRLSQLQSLMVLRLLAASYVGEEMHCPENGFP